MNDYKLKRRIQALLSHADIKVNGDRPWDIQVRNRKFYQRVLSQGSLGLGEAYMDEWWGSHNLDQFFHKILDSELDKKIRSLDFLFLVLRSKIMNRQSIQRAAHVAKRHYDIGNDLFQAMLDKGMNYSCAYWKNAATLDDAQEAKLDLICRKIGIKNGMSVLDIGCGWGGFAKYAAEKYRAKVTGITVSRQQVQYAKELCRNLPVEIRLQDYRSINDKFDAIVSVGMFEHVGYKNYRNYMSVANRCLKDNGIFLLHTIGTLKTEFSTEPWIEKYIFPNGMLPSAKQIGDSIEGLFVMEDWHNFGADYDKTLMAWHSNFNKNWKYLEKNYSRRFYRMWTYYLLSCAGAFRARRNQLWQIVLSKKGVKGGYKSVR